MATQCIFKLRRYCLRKTLSNHLNTGQMNTYNATGMNSTHISYPTRHETTSSQPLVALKHFKNKSEIRLSSQKIVLPAECLVSLLHLSLLKDWFCFTFILVIYVLKPH